MTWSEFISWMESEGNKRDKKHDADLYHRGITRIVEDSCFRLSDNRTEHKINLLLPMRVHPELEVMLVVFEDHRV